MKTRTHVLWTVKRAASKQQRLGRCWGQVRKEDNGALAALKASLKSLHVKLQEKKKEPSVVCKQKRDIMITSHFKIRNPLPIIIMKDLRIHIMSKR